MLPFAGVTIHMNSLFAFILVSGIVVDDAVVVLENITRYTEAGLSRTQAALRGAREVGVPTGTARGVPSEPWAAFRAVSRLSAGPSAASSKTGTAASRTTLAAKTAPRRAKSTRGGDDMGVSRGGDLGEVSG